MHFINQFNDVIHSHVHCTPQFNVYVDQNKYLLTPTKQKYLQMNKIMKIPTPDLTHLTADDYDQVSGQLCPVLF